MVRLSLECNTTSLGNHRKRLPASEAHSIHRNILTATILRTNIKTIDRLQGGLIVAKIEQLKDLPWPKGEARLNEPEAQKTLGADRYVASLREAIDATLAALSEPPASQNLAASDQLR